MTHSTAKLPSESTRKIYTLLGLMSGTSLDGLDLLKVNFYPDTRWRFEILKAETVSYPSGLRNKLAVAGAASALDLALADKELGKFMGEQVNRFLASDARLPFLIANSRHTIFHQPQRGLTYQVGNSDYIVAATGLPVVDNFRTLDVALGGQGAPLVPLGDRHLFGTYTAVLNLGGIANISYEKQRKRIGFDICPCNSVLNRLSQQLDQPFDNQGFLAREGKVNRNLLERWNNLEFYRAAPPKSLGIEWIEEFIFPSLEVASPHNLLATFNHHISHQITNILKTIAPNSSGRNILVTGGGAYNTFLIDLLKAENPMWMWTLPSPEIIEFKEALIFAFLGLLYYLGEVNCLRAVTGARVDSCGGNLHGALTSGPKLDSVSFSKT